MSQKTVKQVIATLGTVLRVGILNSNHACIHFDGGVLLTSYGKPAAIIVYSDKYYICEDVCSYSTTSSRNVNKFLNVDAKGRAQGIKAGSIEVIGG